MIVDYRHYSRVVKNILYLILLIIFVYVILKLFIFFSPFLISIITANLLEPVVKKIMNTFRFSRKLSTIILLLIIFLSIIVITTITFAIMISESSKLLNNLNLYLPNISNSINNIIDSVDIDKLNVSDEIKSLIENATTDLLYNIGNYISNILTYVLNMITKIPNIILYIIITFLATYFICSDRYYIKDQFEYHIPKIWIRKFNSHFKEITIQLLNYLKAELIMIVISFFIVLIGLYILSFIGFDIGFPLIIALFIGLVDALPILGSGTVLVPWAIYSSITGNLSLGLSLLIIYVVVLIARQLIEPKIVSNNIGIHPIFTLIAMYAGFKIFGLIGLIIGPIVLIIYKNIFESLLERGLVKTIFERE